MLIDGDIINMKIEKKSVVELVDIGVTNISETGPFNESEMLCINLTLVKELFHP